MMVIKHWGLASGGLAGAGVLAGSRVHGGVCRAGEGALSSCLCGLPASQPGLGHTPRLHKSWGRALSLGQCMWSLTVSFS